MCRAGSISSRPRTIGSAAGSSPLASGVRINSSPRKIALIRSISLSPYSATVNREMGLIEDDPTIVAQLGRQFVKDFPRLTPAA